MPLTHAAAERIHALIDAARAAARAKGHDFDVGDILARALIRCGLGEAEARAAAVDIDPVARLLHFAGSSHNLAVLAVEEALEAA